MADQQPEGLALRRLCGGQLPRHDARQRHHQRARQQQKHDRRPQIAARTQHDQHAAKTHQRGERPPPADPLAQHRYRQHRHDQRRGEAHRIGVGQAHRQPGDVPAHRNERRQHAARQHQPPALRHQPPPPGRCRPAHCDGRHGDGAEHAAPQHRAGDADSWAAPISPSHRRASRSDRQAPPARCRGSRRRRCR